MIDVINLYLPQTKRSDSLLELAVDYLDTVILVSHPAEKVAVFMVPIISILYS